jgi:hypothetical protein
MEYMPVNMRENHDWVDNKLERRYGSDQYNLAVQEYINTMEPFDIFDNIDSDNDYITYRTPFFGEAYYNYSVENELLIEDYDNYRKDAVYNKNNEEEYMDQYPFVDQYGTKCQNTDIYYDNNMYVGSYYQTKYF